MEQEEAQNSQVWLSITLRLASVGAAMRYRDQNGRGRAELKPSLLLTIWKGPNFYFVQTV